ncbi:hypothetical protein EON63_08240 [archaeon]|nr:MAG: hypothetical protein EON63_08240 [archaeon]
MSVKSLCYFMELSCVCVCACAGTCPSNLGTGLRASVMIKLPHFNHLMESHHHEDKLLLEEVGDCCM